MTNPSPQNDRLMELLALHATQDISPEERTELTTLLEQEDGVTATEFEMAAAAMHLAMTQPEAMPLHVRENVTSTAEEFFNRPNAPVARPAKVVHTESSTTGFRLREALGWLLAAAAIVFAFIRTTGAPDGPQPVPPPTLAELRSELIEDTSTVQLDWKALEDPTSKNVTGDIVWNKKRQAGFMTFSQLAKNDPTEFQYQLWIFDRDHEHPIDGGVFDITDVNSTIPIDAKIDAKNAFQFAVTIEKPGGVVVSKKERIAVLAALPE